MTTNNMTSVKDVYDLISCSELTGESMFDILYNSKDGHLWDFVVYWRDRMSEEIRRRVNTGIVVPIKLLKWHLRGDGWESLDEEVPWEKAKI